MPGYKDKIDNIDAKFKDLLMRGNDILSKLNIEKDMDSIKNIRSVSTLSHDNEIDSKKQKLLEERNKFLEKENARLNEEYDKSNKFHMTQIDEMKEKMEGISFYTFEKYEKQIKEIHETHKKVLMEYALTRDQQVVEMQNAYKNIFQRIDEEHRNEMENLKKTIETNKEKYTTEINKLKNANMIFEKLLINFMRTVDTEVVSNQDDLIDFSTIMTKLKSHLEK